MQVNSNRFNKILTWFSHLQISLIIGIVVLALISSVWVHILLLVEHEYQQDITTINKVETNLVKVVAENLGRNFENIDETLVSLKQEYELSGLINLATLTRVHSLKSLPVLHISMLDETGNIMLSTNPELLAGNRSFREYFRKHQITDQQKILISKAVLQKLPQGEGPWTFHLSYRLNKPDGSFGGVVVAAVNPLYFADLFGQMSLATGSTITMVDLDGNVLARQMDGEFSAGMNIVGAELYMHLKDTAQGVYTTISAIDKVSRFISYIRMQDYPVILMISEKEAEVLAPFYQRRNDYYLAALIISLLLAGGGWLLILLVESLRKANEELGLRVLERTQQLQCVNASLARSNAELEQFAYVASHDLQEPLRMVSSYVQLLARRYKGKLDAEADEFIGFAVDGASRMQELINDLLLYSRLNSRKNEFELIDCNAIVKKALADLQLVIEDYQAQIQVSNLPAVVADQTQLVQVFRNLIGNALKYRGSTSPYIEIDAKMGNDEWFFAVRDNGIGIAPEFFDRIFVMFQRLHNRAEYPGTGIGLALCKKIVERHGGRIWVESVPGKGSTFFFSIPAKGVKL